MKAHSKKEIKLRFSVNSTGVKACNISIEDYPVEFDNILYFSLMVAPHINISLISDSEEVRYLEKVYSNEKFFKASTFSTKNINYHILQQSDFIVLNTLSKMNNLLQNALEEALEKGMHIAIFPSKRSDMNIYTHLLGTSIQNIKDSVQKVSIQLPNEKDPFFKGVFEKWERNMNMPIVKPILTWNSESKTLLYLRNDYPFLSEWKRKKGKVFLFSSNLKKEFGNNATHALFVPVMYKMAIHAKTFSEKLYFTFSDQIASIQLENIDPSDLFKLTTSGREMIPKQRIKGHTLFVYMPENNLKAGNYAVQKMNDDSIYSYLSLNYDKSESQTDYYSPQELDRLFSPYPNVHVSDNMDSENFTKNFAEYQKNTPLWVYMLLLALLSLMMEIALIRFFDRKLV